MATDPMDTMDTAQRAAEPSGTLGAGLADTARQTVDQVAERSRRTLNRVTDTAADVADRVSAQTNDALAQAARYASAHPLQALGVVLIAGFLVGRLSRRY